MKDLYVSRVALEREYAGKLQSLSKKVAERKAKMQGNIFSDGSSANSNRKQRLGSRLSITDVHNELHDCSTLSAAYDEVIASIANCAQVHTLNADRLNTETIETLKMLGRRNDEAKKTVCITMMISYF